MVVYGIESYKKRNKKIIIFIVILSIVIVGTAIFGGIKTAQYVAMKKQEENDEQNLNILAEEKNEVDNQQISQDRKIDIEKLNKEQIKTINNIYDDTKEKIAFLTFDDGPSSNITPKILDILKQENIKATFFVLGTMVKSNPEILKREKEEGHYIANHGYSHVYSKIYAGDKKPLEEYNKTNKLIQEALGDEEYQSKVFRFPGGSEGGYYHNIKAKAKKKLEDNGIASLDWNCLTNDSGGAETKNEIMKNLKSTCKGKNSIVVLMHDAPNKELTQKTLKDVISYLKDEGYKFKSLYDIL